MKFLQGVLPIFLAAVCWSTVSLFARFLYAGGLTPGAVSFWRAALSAGMAWVLVALTGGGVRRPGLRGALVLVLYGLVGCTALFLCFLGSMRYISVPMATALLNTAPVFVTLYSALILRRKLPALQWAAAGMVVLGCALVVQLYNPASWTFAPMGLVLGLLAGCSYAGLSVIGRSVVRHVPANVGLAWMFTIGAFLMLLFVPLPQIVEARGLRPWLLLGGLALVPTLLANVFYLRGLQRVGAPVASVVVMLDPVVSVVTAVLWLRDPFSPVQGVGIFLVLVGAYLGAVQAKQKPPATES